MKPVPLPLSVLINTRLSGLNPDRPATPVVVEEPGDILLPGAIAGPTPPAVDVGGDVDTDNGVPPGGVAVNAVVVAAAVADDDDTPDCGTYFAAHSGGRLLKGITARPASCATFTPWSVTLSTRTFVYVFTP